MTSENGELRIVIPMRYRDARVGRPTDCRADPGDDLEQDTRIRELGRLLAAAGEDHRVAALEPGDDPSLFRVLDDDLVDFVLGDGVVLRTFSDVNFLAAGFRPAEQLGTAQSVVNQHVRRLDALLGAKGDETEIAGAGADEITDSFGCHLRD